jgi:hypothetical protein
VILKVTHNFRINYDANISVSMETIVNDEKEAEELGRKAAKYMHAYLEGHNDEWAGYVADED